MFTAALVKSLQIYGIAIAISLLVALLIKVLVAATSRVKPAATVPVPVAPAAQQPETDEMPGEVLAAISAAVAVMVGPHRILHIVESKRSWSNAGRIAQHAHQPRH